MHLTQQHPQTPKFHPQTGSNRPGTAPKTCQQPPSPRTPPRPGARLKAANSLPGPGRTAKDRNTPKAGTCPQTRQQHPPKMAALPAPAGRSRPEPGELRPCHGSKGRPLGRTPQLGRDREWRPEQGAGPSPAAASPAALLGYRRSPGCARARGPRQRLPGKAALPGAGSALGDGSAVPGGGEELSQGSGEGAESMGADRAPGGCV